MMGLRKKFIQDDRGLIVQWICLQTNRVEASEGPFPSRGEAEDAVGLEDPEPTWVEEPSPSIS